MGSILRQRAAGRLDGLAIVAVLLCPVFLLHGRAIAEGLIGLTAACFLVRSALERDWGWLRRGWVMAAGLWWLWLVACSVQGGFVQALAVVRFLLFVAALEHWVLRVAWRRLWLSRLAALAALYIALQTVLQLVTGHDLQGFPRSGDGELTGPFEHPRAGAPLSRLLFPAVLSVGARWGGVAAMLGGVAVMVLIGQRMPVLLTGLGLLATALLLPRWRRVAVGAGVAAVLLLAASAIVEPPTFYRLVTKFSAQMADFPDSAYGQIADAGGGDGGPASAARPRVRRLPPGLRRPGLFRRLARRRRRRGGDVRAAPPQPLPAGGGRIRLDRASVCSARWPPPGWPASAGACCNRGAPHPLRVGLFVAALIQLWPIASASAFTSMPLSGWFFLLLGLGLAETKAYMTTNTVRGADV